MTPREIERQFEKMGRDLERAATRALNRTAREGYLIARQDSRGRWNRARRRKSGYSYSRFDPKPPPQPLGIINVESGLFLASWYVAGPFKTLNGITSFIRNDSDRAEDLTAHGMPWLYRPIAERIVARLTPVFHFEVEKAIAQAIR